MESNKKISQNHTFLEKTAAWAVHIFTALGLVAGFWSLECAAKGNFHVSFLMLFLALIIDGIDGTFARIFRVKDVLPNISGKTIDYVIDFTTYAFIPTFIIYEANLVPGNLNFFAATIILVTSAIYYGKDGMVSKDFYFIGFPVLWNLVAFYLFYVCGLSKLGNFIAIVFFAILHFVPIKFLYPTRTKKFMKLNILISLVFILSNLIIILIVEFKFEYLSKLSFIKYLSLASTFYFGVIAIFETWFSKNQ